MGQRKELTEDQKRRLQIFLNVFNSDAGQLVLEELRKEYCGSCFDKDPIVMAFKEGQRNLVLDIEWTLNYSNLEKLVEKEDSNG